MALLDIGNIYNALDTDPIFVRFQAGCLVSAKDVKAESPETPNHENRLAWANGILSNDLTAVRSRVRAHLRLAIAGNAAFQSAGTNVTDNDILFMVASNLDTLATG